MKTELIVKFSFEASHSLFDYEIPHPHIWRLEVSILGVPVESRIIDIVKLRGEIDSILAGIKSTYLNENNLINSEARFSPTCETLCPYFFSRIENLLETQFVQSNPSAKLSSVSIAICEMDGSEMGAVKLTV
jgi:6-pyruvoyl-tetrahydropterin synthase